MRRPAVSLAPLLVAVLLGVAALAPAVAGAAPHDSKPGPESQVLAIVSPLALPACSTAGSATLLVPIVGGILQNSLHLPKSVSVANLLLDALGPVYVVCGDLPASPGTRCSLDDQIAAVWPDSLSSEGLSPPAPAGDVVDSLAAALKILHLSVLDATKQALKCRVDKAVAPPPAPPGVLGPVPPVAATVPGGSPVATGAVPPLPGTLTAPTSGSAPPQLAQPVTTSPSLVSAVTHRLPSAVVACQVALALLLALVLVGSWLTSVRLRRARD
ncbi:MAG TPA: hypothetical protein VHV76_10165 [Mycobacteriales bacterium]|jgi:hypothetical protein|nr:hypothetical protein [Mycobacteriales bacterium]